MCDRILVLSSNPGRVVAEIKVPFGHPRNRLDPAFRRLVDDVYTQMTARPTSDNVKKSLRLGTHLPQVSTNLMAGLIENPGGRALSRSCRHAGCCAFAASGGR